MRKKTTLPQGVLQCQSYRSVQQMHEVNIRIHIFQTANYTRSQMKDIICYVCIRLRNIEYKHSDNSQLYSVQTLLWFLSITFPTYPMNHCFDVARDAKALKTNEKLGGGLSPLPSTFYLFLQWRKIEGSTEINKWNLKKTFYWILLIRMHNITALDNNSCNNKTCVQHTSMYIFSAILTVQSYTEF